MAKIRSTQWDTVIKPKSGLMDLHLRECWKYRDLILLFVKRNFIIVYKQTILGPAWAIIQPLLTTLIFTVVFGGIAGLPTDGVPQFLFYMCGNVAWHYFSASLTEVSVTFTKNSRIFGKVYFPRLVMPIATVLTQLINFAIQFVFFLIFLIYYANVPGSGVDPNFGLILLTPLVLLHMALLAMGVGVMISALTTKYRDLAMLVSFGVQLWMYATPVTYPSSMIAQNFPQLMGLYMLNPMASIVELFRAAYLGVGSFQVGYYMISVGITLALLFGGLVLFSKTEKTFMDTV